MADRETARQYLQELKSDMWIDKATQWLRLDFTVMNPEERLFVTLQFYFEIDYSGLVIPHVVSDIYQVVRAPLLRWLKYYCPQIWF